MLSKDDRYLVTLETATLSVEQKLELSWSLAGA